MSLTCIHGHVTERPFSVRSGPGCLTIDTNSALKVNKTLIYFVYNFVYVKVFFMKMVIPA